jgi:hypothetical protein
MTMYGPTRHEIQQIIAYNIWNGAGRPEGKDLDIWLDAGRKLFNNDPEKDPNRLQEFRKWHAGGDGLS